MIWFVHEIAGYSKILIRYNVLMSRKVGYSATVWSQRCRMHQVMLYLLLKKDFA